MEIKLKELRLRNFKGIEKVTFSPAGENAVVRGDNATGKSTLADAFSWLLFNKDSQGSTQFAIKTLDANGQEISNLDHCVEAVLEVDGREIRLSKTYREKWTKKRGEAQKTLTGHTTEYLFDEVPVKESEWNEKLGDIIDETTFRLLTSPYYFNSLHWEKRRALLLEVCGDVRDQDVIASDKRLQDLAEIIENRSIEDHKKVVAGQKRKINERLKELPARIDELKRSVSDVPEIDTAATTARIAELGREISALQNDTDGVALGKKKVMLERDLIALQNEEIKKQTAGLAPYRNAIDTLKKEIQELVREENSLPFIINDRSRRIESNEKEMDRLRAKWREVNAHTTKEGANMCPTCGQTLPPGYLEAALANFQAEKARELERIQAEGKRLKNINEGERIQLDSAQARHREIIDRLTDLRLQLAEAEAVLRENENTPSADTEDMEAIRNEIEGLKLQISDREKPDTSALEAERAALQRDIATHDAAKKTAIRIEDLAAEEKRLAAEYEGLDQQTYLMEEFTKVKVRMLEDRIASKFELARFKMFDVQLNEGIKDTCVTLYNGVPFGQGLNRGMEINIGLDIVRTLSAHYGVTAPIWLDNAEAVTAPIDTGAQTFYLVVDPDYPKLEIQYAEERKVAHG